MIPAPWLALGAVVAVGGLTVGAWSYGVSYGDARATLACQEAQERARAAHDVEVARIADAASVAAAEALAARQTVRSMTDALRRETRPACAVDGADADRVRGILDAARGAAAKPPAR